MFCVSGGSTVAAEAGQRQQGRSDMATVGSATVALATQGQRQQRSGSRAVFAGTWQLRGRDEWGKRVAGHWRQLLQQSGGTGSCMATAASARECWWQHRDGTRVAGRRQQGGDASTAAAGRC
jgi:hypothetical protein